MSQEEKAWIRGFCTALADIHRLLLGGHNSSGVCEVAKAALLSRRAAKYAGVAERDIVELDKVGVWAATG
jgi:hypothetical protein